MSRIETHITIICHASVITEARALAAHFPGGAGMLVTPLYTDSEVTHYISTGMIDQSVADMLDDPADFAAVVGADPVQVQAIRDQMDISTEGWEVALSRLGLALEVSE
jgi:hypothetical protein